MNFSGDLGEYKWVETEDKSWTLWSENFDENCHSLAGAREETRYNFIEGCELKQLDENENLTSVHILEVGFGLGVGLNETYQFWKEHLKTPMTFISLELDKKLVEEFLANSANDLSAKWNNSPVPHYDLSDPSSNFHSRILIGDAREALPAAKEAPLLFGEFHAIYQDPFSPKKNPQLWSLQWFTLLKELSHHNVRLSTYSASYSVRKALLEAGWFIENRKGFKHKKSSTRAFLDPQKGEEYLMSEIRRAKIQPISD